MSHVDCVAAIVRVPRSRGTKGWLGGLAWLAVWIGALVNCLAASDPLSTWLMRYPAAVTCSDAAYANGRYVLVGDLGLVLTSPDLVTWSHQNVGVEHSFLAISFGNGRFVAISARGQIDSSTDAVTWTEQQGPADLRTVIFTGQSFVAVGGQGLIMTSPDGLTWTRCDAHTDADLVSLAQGTAQLVAVGGNLSGGTILTSSNGAEWTVREQLPTPVVSIAHGGGRFLALTGPDGNGHSNLLAAFENAQGWTATQFWGASDFESIAFGNGMFAALYPGGLATSPDGVVWTEQESVPGENSGRLTFAGSQFLAIYRDAVMTSADGANWRTLDLGDSTPRSVIGMTFAEGRFVAVGENGLIETSPDGIAWTERAYYPNHFVEGVAYGNGTFVAVGFVVHHESFFTLTSPDGVVWQPQTNSAIGAFHAIAFGNSTFVAAGEDPSNRAVALTSSDGRTWQTNRMPTGAMGLSGITFGGGQFVAVGSGATVLTSNDGANWAQQTSGVTGQLRGILYAEGLYVAGGFNLLSSPDAIHWTVRLRTDEPGIEALAYGNGVFTGVGSVPRSGLWTSTDGINWTTRTTFQDALAVTFGQSRFVAGWSGIFQSDPVPLQPKFQVRALQRIDPSSLRVAVLPIPGQKLVLESSFDLSHWQSDRELTVSPESVDITEPMDPTAKQKFFRIRQ